jgi:hypothetical protein
MSTGIPGVEWPVHRMFPTFQAPERLAIYDIGRASKDRQLTISTLVGMINRPKPQVYLLFHGDDEAWLQEIPASIEQQRADISNDNVLDDLLVHYRELVKGMIIYDPHMLDSINVATTLAGQVDGIVVSPEQAEALRLPYNLPVLGDLRVHRWSNGTEAYDWARKHLLAGASPRIVAGLDPTLMGGLRAFLVATRAFVYWLDARQLLPDFRHGLPLQRSQRWLMQQIFKTFAPGTVHLGWFIDEFSGVALASEAALPVLASDHFTNLEVWTSIQPVSPLVPVPQILRGPTAPSPTAPSPTAPSPTAPSPTAPSPGHPQGVSLPYHDRVGTPLAGVLERWQGIYPPQNDAIYLAFTMSDGDNLQYMQHKMLQLWRDPARERVPLGWTIAPVIAQAAPVMAAYYANTVTANNELLAGPSGAGYMYPSRWPSDQLPAFLEQTGQLMRDMNLTLLEVLDIGLSQIIGVVFGRLQAFSNTTLQRAYVQALKPFGLRGILSGSGGKTSRWSIKEDIPIMQNLGLAGSPTSVLQLVRRAVASRKQRPLFLNVYVEAWSVTPSQIEQVIKEPGSEYIVVTPGTLLALIAQATK